jgi:hypothetical protein
MPEPVYIERQDQHVSVQTYTELPSEMQDRLDKLHDEYQTYDSRSKQCVPLTKLASIVVMGELAPDNIQYKNIHHDTLVMIRDVVAEVGDDA